MKRCVLTALVVFVSCVTLVAAADARTVQEGRVGFDVPQGWSYTYNKDADLVAIFPGDDLNTAAAVVTVNYHELRGTVEEAVEFFATSYKAEKSVKKAGNGVYTFTGSVEGNPVACRLASRAKDFVLTCAVGTDALLEKIAASVQYVGN